jgi:hypothetical protein
MAKSASDLVGIWAIISTLSSHGFKISVIDSISVKSMGIILSCILNQATKPYVQYEIKYLGTMPKNI